jgi:DtxR family Mn-dependent transcriptional regulator
VKKTTKATITQEDYLKTIWELSQEGGSSSGSKIAAELGVTPPAVSLALRRLAKEGYLKLGKDGKISLTLNGRKTAEDLIIRHRLIEKLLAEVLGMEWYKVHEEAEKLEHSVSPEMEERLFKLFGRHGTCPHGNPLGKAALRKIENAVLLFDAPAGLEATVVRIYEKDRTFLEYLDSLGITPQGNLEVLEKMPDDTLKLKIASRPVTLGKKATTRIWVEPKK